MSSTVARPSQKPVYKDYVSFLENYKNGSTPSAPSSTTNRDVVDCSATKFQSYHEYLNNYKSKKFNPVKPQLNDNPDKSNNKIMKSEIFIEIQQPDCRKINEKISIFENTPIKPQLSTVPPVPTIKKQEVATIPPPPPLSPSVAKKQEQPTVPIVPNKKQEVPIIPPPPPFAPIVAKKAENSAVQPPTTKFATLPRSGNYGSPPPPPPLPVPSNTVPVSTTTVNKAPLTNQRSLDKNDPRIRKLVNGALRDLYGAYHDRANDIVATLPRSMVKKNNNIQNIINDIALRGDLDKLNGRVNPKSEQE